jgi:hypothetical protein
MEEDSSKVFFKDQEIMVLGLQERAIRWIGLSQGSKRDKARVLACLGLAQSDASRTCFR